MAGPGVALRLHEESRRTGPHCGTAGGSMTISRQGRDVLGLYPGQLARVHVINSSLHRQVLMSVENPPRSPRLREDEQNQCSFDLLTLRNLEVSRATLRETHTSHTRVTTRTTYQDEFSQQAHLYPAEDLRLTPVSHPVPLLY